MVGDTVRIIRFLIGLVLFEAATMGLVFSLAHIFDLHSAAHWQRLYFSEKYEYESCTKKHTQLTVQIKREGLWARMGMEGQPWLAR